MLTYATLGPTAQTLLLWSQIVGKVRLAHTPWVNHGWHVTLRVSARGLATPLIPNGAAALQIERVFGRFRSRFIGKCSPIHFFWGGADPPSNVGF